MPATTLQIEPVTPSLGAMVHGVDLGKSLDDNTFNALHDAWMEHLVLFFRDQTLDPTSLQNLGRRFGTLHVHPQGDMKGFEGILKIYADKNSKTYAGRKWHADVTCDAEPPFGSILHMHQVPSAGGDTLFANMYEAYDALSAPMRAFLEGLRAVHASEHNFAGYYGTTAEETRDGDYPVTHHPVVTAHPVTGRKALYVNEIFTTGIVGLEPEESRAVLDFLYRHIGQPRFQCRFRWEPNSVAMWDNRSTQHLAMFDYWPETRAGHRVTIKGERPTAT
ncbi:MAG: taurine dioxygenase [Rhodospirillaceae bacterium]|nr:taurine dioxygenase [Rhodospirillaceae bacterium]|tara:strand:- start:14056 stop:14886 length:831 start_codon:yes stop_codon:yes gene_type:complete